MSDSESPAAFVPFVTRTVAGKEIQFAKFTPRDRAALLKDLRQRRRSALEANCKAANLPAEQVFAELEAFDDKLPFGERVFVQYLNTPEGQSDVHRCAFVKQNPAADADASLANLILSDGDSLSLAADICNIPLVATTPATDTGKEGDEANPTEPGKLVGYAAATETT